MFWALLLEPGKRVRHTVESSFHLTMAALEPKLTDSSPNKCKTISVILEREKKEYILCNLDQEKLLQQTLDLVFVEGEEVTFYVNGENNVHLTGYEMPETDFEDDDMYNMDSDIESEQEMLSNSIEKSKNKRKQLNESSASGKRIKISENEEVIKKKAENKPAQPTKSIIKNPNQSSEKKTDKQKGAANGVKGEKTPLGDDDFNYDEEDEDEDEEDSDDVDMLMNDFDNDDDIFGDEDDDDDDDDDDEDEEDEDEEEDEKPKKTASPAENTKPSKFEKKDKPTDKFVKKPDMNKFGPKTPQKTPMKHPQQQQHKKGTPHPHKHSPQQQGKGPGPKTPNQTPGHHQKPFQKSGQKPNGPGSGNKASKFQKSFQKKPWMSGKK